MRSLSIFAYTDPAWSGYPSYVSVNEVHDGVREQVEITVRTRNGDTALAEMGIDQIERLRDSLSAYLAKKAQGT